MGNKFQDVIHMEYQVGLRYTGESQAGRSQNYPIFFHSGNVQMDENQTKPIISVLNFACCWHSVLKPQQRVHQWKSCSITHKQVCAHNNWELAQRISCGRLEHRSSQHGTSN